MMGCFKNDIIPSRPKSHALNSRIDMHMLIMIMTEPLHAMAFTHSMHSLGLAIPATQPNGY